MKLTTKTTNKETYNGYLIYEGWFKIIYLPH